VSAASPASDRRIRRLRGQKPRIDPWKAHGSLVEEERRPNGATERALTIFLAGAECPFTCSFCDLWRYTIDGPTPPGALPKQIADTLASIDVAPVQRIKLYNASNFFDRRAVPVADWPRIADLCSSFAGVTVESHANTIGSAATDFARVLSGRLEVAMGLETVHVEASKQLNKRLDLDRFGDAMSFLAERGIDARVFVLLGAPFVPPHESVEWAVRSVEHAIQRGAGVVSIVPVRGGNGEMERLAAIGRFTQPTLRQLESALDRCLKSHAVVTADLWDVERLPACSGCRTMRIERLRRQNLTGVLAPAIACQVCNDQ
jgi:radical SAM enzyme (TIGR01210 family)